MRQLGIDVGNDRSLSVLPATNLDSGQVARWRVAPVGREQQIGAQAATGAEPQLNSLRAVDQQLLHTVGHEPFDPRLLPAGSIQGLLQQPIFNDCAQIIARQVDRIESNAGRSVLVPDMHLFVITDALRVQLLPDSRPFENFTRARADCRHPQVIIRVAGAVDRRRYRLDQRHPETIAGERIGGAGADHTGAGNDDVELRRIHRCPRNNRLPPKVMPIPAYAAWAFSAGSISSMPNPAARS